MKRVIISGGGTGGHIFPALAIANEIRKRFPDADILFVGADSRMEMEKVPQAGYKIIGLPVTGLPRKPGIGMLKFAVRLLKSYNTAQKIINQFRPQIAIGVGGFASGPLLRAAAAKRVPYLIQEQNSFAGITNKLLGKNAGAVCVAFEGMEKYFPADKIVITGNPVRENLKATEAGRQEAADYFGLKKDKKTVLVLGGSLGAQSVNEAVMKGLDRIAASDVQFIWQTGSIYYRRIIEKLKDRVPENLLIVEFISRMELAYAAADVVISRAGAGTISELCLVGKPAILVPSPNVAEDHQTKNAAALADREAAIMIPDSLVGKRLIVEAVKLVADREKRRTLSENIKKLAERDADVRIAGEVLKLIRK